MECNSVTALFFAALSSAGRRGLAPLAGPLISCEKMETMMGRGAEPDKAGFRFPGSRCRC